MKIKVCGMKDPQNIHSLAELKPDYVGLIFYPKSKRYIADLDKTILASLPSTISLTGVFVNETEDNVVEKVLNYGLNSVQLHGGESPEYCRHLRLKLSKMLPNRSIQLIKAFGIDPEFDFSSIETYNDVVDFFLFDTKTSALGGSGIAFDWTILEQYEGEKQFFLSGGLSPENIKDLFNFNTKKIYALDLNSKFEIEPGIKNIESIRSTFQLIRSERIY